MSFDASLLTHMMSDTNEIQDILSESLREGDAFVMGDGTSDAEKGDARQADAPMGDANASVGHDTAQTQGDDDGNDMHTIAEAIIGAFDGRDEMQVGALQQAVIAASGDAGMTSAKAMGVIAAANEWYEATHDETLVDIDGPLALLEI